MTVDVLTEIVIDQPKATVVEYAGDPTNAPHWYANIQSVRWQTSPPVRTGSRMDFVARSWAGPSPTPMRSWSTDPIAW